MKTQCDECDLYTDCKKLDEEGEDWEIDMMWGDVDASRHLSDGCPFFIERKPYWMCQECCFTDREKAMPKDREKFYASERAQVCPKCRSEAFVPVGF